VVLTDRYVRALFEEDYETLRELDPRFDPGGPAPVEAGMPMAVVDVQRLSAEEAGDAPDSPTTWTRILVDTPIGVYQYDVGVQQGPTFDPSVVRVRRTMVAEAPTADPLLPPPFPPMDW
jgi:hypothetical protein